MGRTDADGRGRDPERRAHDETVRAAAAGDTGGVPGPAGTPERSAATTRLPPPPPTDSRRRPFFLRAFLRALLDPSTYDVRRNTGLWLGFLLALPIPVLALASSSPLWIVVVSLSAPVVWAAILGAAGRVAGLRDREVHTVTAAASTAGRRHATERAALRGAADSERTERERLESLQALLQDELALAQRVHHSLLPSDIVRADVEVVVRQVPCSYVGGDYLHAALPRPDLLYLCVGDVSGHGVSAALVVSRIHGLMQRLVLEQHAPERILEDLDRATRGIVEHTPFFMTFAVFRVDLFAKRIDYATGGHPAQLLLRSDATTELLATENGCLGLGPAVLGPVRPRSVTYAAGDTLVLFTDGLFEVAPRGGGEMLGESGLLSGLGRLAGSAPDVLASEVLRKVTDFGRLGPFADDVSLMVARFGPPPVPPRELSGATPGTP